MGVDQMGQSIGAADVDADRDGGGIQAGTRNRSRNRAACAPSLRKDTTTAHERNFRIKVIDLNG